MTIIKYLEITEGDCFYDTLHESIVRIDKIGGYYVTITKVYESNFILKDFKRNSIGYETTDIAKTSLIHFKEPKIKIDPLLIFRIIKLLEVNINICHNLLRTFEKLNNGVIRCFTTTEPGIDLYYNKNLLHINKHLISYTTNCAGVYYNPSYYISVEDYNKLDAISSNTYKNIKKIFDKLKEGA